MTDQSGESRQFFPKREAKRLYLEKVSHGSVLEDHLKLGGMIAYGGPM
jgi:hypothetical protein